MNCLKPWPSCPPSTMSAGNAEALPEHLGGVDAEVAHLLQQRRDREPRLLVDHRLLLDDEAREAAVARLRVRVGDRQQHDHAGVQAVRDPLLVPVDDVVVPVADRPDLDRLHVGAGVRLRDREGPAHLAGGHPREQPLLLLAGPEVQEHPGRHEVRVHDAGERDPRARDLRDDLRVGHEVEAEAAVLLRDGGAEEPELAHPLHERLGVGVVAVVLRDRGERLVVDEAPHVVQQCVGGHGQRSITRLPSSPNRALCPGRTTTTVSGSSISRGPRRSPGTPPSTRRRTGVSTNPPVSYQ